MQWTESPAGAASRASARRRRHLGALLAAVALAAAAVVLAGSYERRSASAELRLATRHRLDIFALSLRNAVERVGFLPFTVAQHSEVRALLRNPADAALATRVDGYLRAITDASGAAVTYVMDRDGLTLASSNAGTPESFVARNFSFRPYFEEAARGGTGRFYGVGALTGQPGYFISQSVQDAGGAVVGVTAVKLSLDGIEKSWRDAADVVLLFDRHDVAFLASRTEWKLSARRAPDSATLAYLDRTRQYARKRFEPLPLRPAGAGFVRDVAGQSYLVEEIALPELGWRMQLLTATRPIEEAVVLARIATASGFGMLYAGAWALRQRRRRNEERRAAQAELEQKVVERTAELSAANLALQAEIVERRRTERELRDAQQELVQAAKLALLGQMAAGITHELNQPLSALDATAAAAQKFVAQGRADKLDSALCSVRALVYRLGKITGQLRAFSRKSGGQPQAVPLATAIANALFLIRQGSPRNDAEIVLPPIDENLRVIFDPIRLEQVLVNLLRNALDATAQRADARIEFMLQEDDERLRLALRDNGPGLCPQALAAVFEPFFTTKPAGEGLGLGLAISQSIAREYDAQLNAANACEGGAVFTLNLRLASD